MLWPLIGVRLHGILDDLVALTFLLGAFVLHLQGAARTVALAGATTISCSRASPTTPRGR